MKLLLIEVEFIDYDISICVSLEFWLLCKIWYTFQSVPYPTLVNVLNKSPLLQNFIQLWDVQSVQIQWNTGENIFITLPEKKYYTQILKFQEFQKFIRSLLLTFFLKIRSYSKSHYLRNRLSTFRSQAEFMHMVTSIGKMG